MSRAAAGAGVAAGLALAALAIWTAGASIDRLSTLPGPPHERAMRAALMTDLGLASRGAQAADALAQEARTLNRRAPLAAEPFLVAGALADIERPGQGPAFYRAGLRRDPRSRAAHFMLARSAFLEGESGPGLRHLVAVARLAPGAAPEVSQLLTRLAADPVFEPTLVQFLREEPGQADTLFAAMAGQPALADRLFRLAPPRRGDAPSPGWLTGLADTLLAANDIDRAARAWTLYGTGGDPRRSLIRDPGFSGSVAAPFGWRFEGGEGSNVDHGAGGLEVQLFGEAPVRIASQVLLLAPGRYRLDGDTEGAVDRLEWRIGCPGRLLSSGPANGQWAFAVPTDCPRQAIELWSRSPSGSDTGSVTARVRGVRLAALAP